MSRRHRARRVARVLAFGGVLPTITLGALTLNGTLTQGVATSGVTITGATPGSTITLSVAGLTISGSGATRTVSGTPTGAGILTASETLAGASNNGRQTVVGSVVATIFNVMNYGAVADSDGTAGSGTDNVAAFSAARDAAVAAGGGKIIVPNVGTGKFRLATAAFPITTSNIVFEGQGFAEMFFDTADITTFGRLIFDGGVVTGEISNVGVQGSLRVTNRINVAVAGVQPGYNGCACLITFRGCANFFCTGTDTRNSPNYHISLLRSRDGSVTNNTGRDGTGDGVHAQDGCVRILIDGNTFDNMGDDIVGIGYWGAKNTDITVTNNTGTGCGACGIAVYAPSENVTVRGNRITSTYNSGIKCAPLSKLGGANNVVKGLIIDGNTIVSAGMRSPAAFSRGDGVACGIHLAPGGGTIVDATVTNNTGTNARNSFLVTDPTSGGSIGTLVVTDNVFNGIAATGGQGATTSKNPDGSNATGNSRDTPDTSHPGIVITSIVVNATEARNTVTGAAGAAIVNTAQNAPVTPPAAATVADNYDRADAAPAVGALGSTSTGGKAWSGAAAGISGSKATFGSTSGNYSGTAIDFGASDVDVFVKVTIAANQNGRLVARATSDPTSGASLFLSTDGSFGYYNGTTFYRIGSAMSALAAGTHTLRLVVKGNVATAYVNGAQVRSGSPALPNSGVMQTTGYVGIQNGGGTAGSALFDDFSVGAAT